MRWSKCKAIAATLLGVIVAYGIFVQVFFLFHFFNNSAIFFSRFIVVPAVVLGGDSDSSRITLSYREVAQLARLVESFDEALKIDVHRMYVEQLADELGVTVSAEEIADYAASNKQLNDNLVTTGWSENDYLEFVVGPLLLAHKVELAAYDNHASQEPAQQELAGLLSKVDQGIPFADVAKYFSQDFASAKLSGSFELTAVEQLPAWLTPAVKLSPGDRSQILSAGDAYWVVELVSRETIDDQEYVRFRGIAVKKKSLGEIIAARQAAHPPFVLVW